MAVKIEVKGPLMSNDIAQLYHYFEWDACCPKDISAKLGEAAGDEVILEINSPGGYCSAGYEMYTLLMDYEGKITAHVIEAASAASLLVCAADEALASDTCIFMIHNTQSSTSGDYRDMQASAEALKEFNAGIINAYVRKTGKTREELQALMDNETYMSAQTAIKNGFIDGYLFGSPDGQGIEGTADVQDNIILQVMDSAFPVITDGKAKEILALLKMQEGSVKAASGINCTGNNPGKGDKTDMTLEEMYAEHPELRDEVAAIVKDAETKGFHSFIHIVFCHLPVFKHCLVCQFPGINAVISILCFFQGITCHVMCNLIKCFKTSSLHVCPFCFRIFHNGRHLIP